METTMKIANNILFRLLIWLGPLLLVCEGQAQPQEKKIAPEIAQLLATAPARASVEEAGAVILRKDMTMTVAQTGLRKITIHVLGKILNEQARSDYAQIPINYNSYYDDLSLDFAHTIKKDGALLEISKDAVQIKTPPSLTGEKEYSDMRVLVFSLPALEVGCGFEFQATIQDKRPVIANRWFENFYFNFTLFTLLPPFAPRIDPARQSRLEVRVPQGETFQYQTVNVKISPAISQEAGQDLYVWETQDLPAIAVEEGMPGLDEIAPSIALSSLKSWREIDAWASERLLARANVTPMIAAKAAELTREAATPEQKIAALYRFIQQEIDYVQADLGRDGYMPHPPEEVLTHKYGDCKDRVTLLIALLKAAGISAYPALIDLYAKRDVPKELPSTNFPHLIVYLPLEQEALWLETTSAVTAFPSLHWSDQERWAFVINGQGGEFLETPSSPPEDNTVRFESSVRFENELATVRWAIATSGAVSDNIKSFFAQIQPRQQKEALREFAQMRYSEFRLHTLEYSDLKNPQTPFNATLRFALADTLDEKTPVYFYPDNASFALSFYPSFTILPAPEGRRQDFIFGHKLRFEFVARYAPPTTDFKPSELPEADSLQSSFLNFQKSFLVENDTVQAQWRLTLKQQRIPAKQYQAFYDDAQRVLKKLEWTVLFNGGIVQKIKQALTADSAAHYNYLGADLLRAERYDEAIVASQKALQHNSKSVSARKNLGRAYFEKARYDEAIASFKKVLKSDRDDVGTHNYLGRAYLAKQQYDESIRAFKNALKVEPEYKYAHYNLGLAYGRKARYDEAIAAHQRALKIDSQYHAPYHALIVAHGERGRFEEAVAIFQRAVAVDSSCSPSHGNMGWAYYLMGDFEKCIAYSQKAVALDSTAMYARYNIPLAYLQLGQIEKAKELYAQTKAYNLSLYPRVFEGAITDLKQLIQKGLMAAEAQMILNEIFEAKALSRN